MTALGADGVVLAAKGLGRRFGDKAALLGLDLEVRSGEIFCLLGPNGAGKTTTLNLFAGFLRPTEGMAAVGGFEVARAPLVARRMLAYVPEQVALYPRLSGLENLEYFVRLGGLRTDRATLAARLTEAGLPVEAHRRPATTYSKGMRQRVALALAATRGARALLLDEPTSGLDPAASKSFIDFVRGMAVDGAAILATTHDLLRVGELADHVGVMAGGRLRGVLSGADAREPELERRYLELADG